MKNGGPADPPQRALIAEAMATMKEGRPWPKVTGSVEPVTSNEKRSIEAGIY
jgi:hypothetical protein